jgi:hypothetical protein
VAIRPTDIQGAIWQSTQSAPQVQRAEEAPRAAQAAAQAAFVAQVQQRNESVAQIDRAEGNRVSADAEGRRDGNDKPQERRRRSAFEQHVDDEAGLDEPPHLVDFTA